MRSGHFENGKQVGAWTTYDAKGKGRQIGEDEGPGLIDPSGAARCCSEARAAQKISARPTRIDNRRWIFHRSGVTWGCPEFRCGWRWILTTSMPKLSTRGLPKSGCR